MARDNRYSYAASTGSPLIFPPAGSDEPLIVDYKNRHFNYTSLYRDRVMERISTNLYYVGGRQWIELDTEVIMDSRGYILKNQKQTGEAELPRPVSNYIAPAVEVEMAALGRRELMPKVVAGSQDPAIQAAVRRANDIMAYKLDKLDWGRLRDLFTYLTIVTGTGIICSRWDEPWTNLDRVPTPNAMGCPRCGLRVASPEIPSKDLPGVAFPESAKINGDSATLELCPRCENPTQLVPINPTQEEVMGGEDRLGRPFGIDIPHGDVSIEVVDAFSYFPENGGIGVDVNNLRIHGQASVRSMDYVYERYPELEGELTPEDPYELMRWHPTMGEWAILGRYDRALDSGIYENHIREFTLTCGKTMDYPQGRKIILYGDKVAEDTTLYEEADIGGQPVMVPKIAYYSARYKPRHGEFWGKGLVDDLISPQNRVNGLDAQAIDCIERLGSPNILVTEGMNLQGPSWFDDYGSGKIMVWSLDPVNPSAKPEIFGGLEVPASFSRMREQAVADMKQIAGPQDIEIGEAPRNITTTSGLQLLGESAEQKRAPREREIFAAFKQVWEHMLRLLNVYRDESEVYRAKTQEGGWEDREFNKTDLLGLCDVEVEKQGYISRSLFQKEAAREAMMDQLYTIDSPLAKKRLLELRGLPTDVNENWSLQVDRARQQWIDFVDSGIMPYIDYTLDDFAVRFETLGDLLLGDKGKKLELLSNWPAIAELIAGWEQELDAAEAKDAAARAFYGGPLPPDQAQMAYDQAMGNYQMQMQQFQQSQQEQVRLAKDAGSEDTGRSNQASMQISQLQGMAPPQPPPAPFFLPNSMVEKILIIWRQMIQMQTGMPNLPPPVVTSDPNTDPSGAVEQQELFLRFRATIDAYKRLAERKLVSGAMGVPGLAAPGTPTIQAPPPTPGAQPPTVRSPRV